MRPFWKVLDGSCLDVLPTLPEQSVQCVVTSPPYWGLRNYGHSGQFGQEPTLDEYVAHMVDVFRQVRRVLADDGVVWLVLGDSYTSGGRRTRDPGQSTLHPAYADGRFPKGYRPDTPRGMKRKDLIGIPWTVAFALRDDGWYLRQDNIWSKTNPMFDSTKDRTTRSHEYVFHLTKNEHYFYDAEAIQTPIKEDSLGRDRRARKEGYAPPGQTPQRGQAAPRDKQRDHGSRRYSGANERWDAAEAAGTAPTGANKRSVWTVSVSRYKGDHYATFPPDLIEPCILAGSRVIGKHCDCDTMIRTPTGGPVPADPTLDTGRAGMNRERHPDGGVRLVSRRVQRGHALQMRESPHRAEMATQAGTEAFKHYIRRDGSGARPLPQHLVDTWTACGWLLPVPACRHPLMPSDVVLDPFAGSGTTGEVAIKYSRSFIGIEINAEYANQARERCSAAETVVRPPLLEVL